MPINELDPRKDLALTLVVPRLQQATLLTLLSVPMIAAATDVSWLSLCHSSPTTGMHLTREYIELDGSSLWLQASEQPQPSCQSLEMPVSADQIRWFGRITSDQANQLGRGLILQGIEGSDGPQISEVITNASLAVLPEHAVALPLGENLLPDLNLRTFGNEHRATATVTDGVLELHCSAGLQPAGVILRRDQMRLPAAINVDLRLDHHGDPGFNLEFTVGLHTAEFCRLSGSGQPELALALTHDPKSAVDPDQESGTTATFGCPEGSGALRVTDLMLLPESSRPPPPRATWIWRAEEWLERPDDLLDELAEMKVGVTYISIPIERSPHRVSNPELLGAFLTAAAKRGIEIWAVEGDPHAVIPSGRTEFVHRAEALSAFNASQESQSRLAGIQYDIEPYLLPGFSLNTEAWLKAYVGTVAAIGEKLSEGSKLPMEIAVPFWWADLEIDGQPLLDALAPIVDSLNVMDYRTDPRLIQQFAEPFLAWAEKGHGQVRIALEAGPIADETRWHFFPSESGKLWHLHFGGEDLLVLTDTGDLNSAGAAFRAAFSMERMSTVPGERLTFHQERQHMDAMVAHLERMWSSWSGFAGVSLHEYRSNTVTAN